MHDTMAHRNVPQPAPRALPGRPPWGASGARLLIVPGLHDSGPAHWQSWLQQVVRGSVRVTQADWHRPDLDTWADRVEATLEAAGPGPWLAAAHSFGVLALARVLERRREDGRAPLGLAGALLVAPADPAKFSVEALLPHRPLPLPTLLVASDTDPWMSAGQALEWARRWDSGYLNLGDAGHINAEAGFGPLPLARRWCLAMQQRLVREQRLARTPPGDAL